MKKHSTLLGDVGRALERNDVAGAKQLMHAHSDELSCMTPFGTWLHYVAGQGNLETTKFLVEFGLDVNAPDHREGRLAIDAAASNGHVDVVRYLLDQGSRLDTSSEVRNPLFGAIMGRSPEVARLLLERGIDASVRYGPKSAIAFALWQNQHEIARIIAFHLANGDNAEIERLLRSEGGVASRQGTPRATRILPTNDDIEGD